ncbi:MAG TPA: phytoene/squalene synthase family protein [Bryobacteraceae bacterium]|nr:phytoene/squalene synthase family protein [Bryobacteraceae bacterium]
MTLAESYAYCARIARRRARNFYYSFLLLPAPQRRAMCAIYAFMRYCDDLSDDEALAGRAAAIARWREDLDAALAGQVGSHPIWPAFRDAVERYRIPHRYFHEMIEGVSSDLEPRSIAAFDELYDYCYHVASVVGLTVIHIFGFDSPLAPDLAEKCGIAFQLTNILRDIREDSELGRVYVPREDLDRFGVSAEEFRCGGRSENFVRLMRFEAERANRYYRESELLLQLIHEESRPSLWALIEIYSRLLKRIEKSNFDVLSRRISLPPWEKAWIVVRALLPGNRHYK